MKRYAEAVTGGGIPQANIVLEEVITSPWPVLPGAQHPQFR